MTQGPARSRANTARPVRILIADDHPIVRRMVRSALDAQVRFEVCGEAIDGAKAIAEAQRLEPDVVVLDISMPVMDGIEAAREIKARLPNSPVVILSTHTDEHLVEQAKAIGARAYVAKARAGEARVGAIDTVMAGGGFVFAE